MGAELAKGTSDDAGCRRVLAVVVSLFRVLGRGALSGGTRLRRLAAVLNRFGHELLDTLALVGPTFGGTRSDDRQGRRLEIAVYRVLLVCALIGLANSNPTMRQMFDALL